MRLLCHLYKEHTREQVCDASAVVCYVVVCCVIFIRRLSPSTQVKSSQVKSRDDQLDLTRHACPVLLSHLFCSQLSTALFTAPTCSVLLTAVHCSAGSHLFCYLLFCSVHSSHLFCSVLSGSLTYSCLRDLRSAPHAAPSALHTAARAARAWRRPVGVHMVGMHMVGVHMVGVHMAGCIWQECIWQECIWWDVRCRR